MEFRTRRFCWLGSRIFILRITMISSRRRGKATTLWHLPQKKNDFFIPRRFFRNYQFVIVWRIWYIPKSFSLFDQKFGFVRRRDERSGPDFLVKRIFKVKRVICQCKKSLEVYHSAEENIFSFYCNSCKKKSFQYSPLLFGRASLFHCSILRRLFCIFLIFLGTTCQL